MAVATVDGAVFGVGDWERPVLRCSPSPSCSRWPWSWPVPGAGRGSVDSGWAASPRARRSTRSSSWRRERHPPQPVHQRGRARRHRPAADPDRRRSRARCWTSCARRAATRPSPSTGRGRLRGRARRPQRRAGPLHGVATATSTTRSPTYWTSTSAQCSIAACCRDLALAGRFLARHGLRADGTRLLHPERGQAHQRGDADLRHLRRGRRVRLPRRPARQERRRRRGHRHAPRPGCALSAWSPALDRAGNSVAAVAALDPSPALRTVRLLRRRAAFRG